VRSFAVIAVCLSALSPARAQQRASINEIRSDDDAARAFIGAEIIPINAPPISAGVLVIRTGRIEAVGPAGLTPIPDDARRIDCRGEVIMPGLIDTHSHVGGGWGGDSSGPIQPDVRVWDSINVRDSGFKKALAGGLTTLNVMPGSGHLCSGQTIYLKLRPGAGTIEDWAIRDDSGEILGGLKMANGTNSQRESPFPGTRSKSAALVRQKFIDALEYRDKLAAPADDPEKRPDRNLELESLVEVLEGRRVVHHHTHRNDDIITVLRLKKEFGFKVVLHHVSEAWMVADEIAEAGAPCSVILVDSPGGKIEAAHLVMKTAGILEKAGVLTALHTDDPITDSRLFFRMAALCVRAGMTRQAALEALTIAGAKMLELDGRIGTLEPGKDADFIILDGDPLSVYTKVLQTYVEGNLAFDRDNPNDRLFAVGGYGAGQDQVMHFCCFEGPDHQ
jgi:imidazolonepropionase-like amidohydrolase